MVPTMVIFCRDYCIEHFVKNPSPLKIWKSGVLIVPVCELNYSYDVLLTCIFFI